MSGTVRSLVWFLVVLFLFSVATTHALAEGGSRETPLQPDGGTARDGFGTSVAMDGDRIAVGAPRNDTAGPDAGAVWVYHRSGGAWKTEALLTPQPPADGILFGTSVALHKDLLVVGAPRADDADSHAGKAFLYQRSGTQWNLVTTFLPTGNVAGAGFGEAVAVHEGTVVVGAPREDQSVDESAGAAYVYVQDEGGTWTEQQELKRSGAPGALFGTAVDIYQDRIVVGAPYQTSSGQLSGAAYIYDLDTDMEDWIQTTILLPPQNSAFHEFGSAVDVHVDTIAVGSPQRNLSDDPGQVTVFQLEADNVWRQEGDTLTGDKEKGWFGAAVGLDGDRLLVGAPGNPASGLTGSAVYFFRTEDGWERRATFVPADAATADMVGSSVDVAGTDAVVGIPRADRRGEDSGAVRIFDLSDPAPWFTFTPEAPDALTPVAFQDWSSTFTSITSWTWDFGDGNTSLEPDPVHAFANDGEYAVRLRVVTDSGDAAEVTRTIVVGNNPPIASFDAVEAYPGTWTFTATATDPDGIVTAWAWDLDGDGETDATGATIETDYDTPGSFNVTLTVYDDDGAMDTVTQIVTVTNDAPHANFILEVNGTLLYVADNSTDGYGGITAWAWDLDGDGETDATDATVETRLPVGTYTVSLTVTDRFGATDTATQEVTLETPPRNEGPAVGILLAPILMVLVWALRGR